MTSMHWAFLHASTADVSHVSGNSVEGCRLHECIDSCRMLLQQTAISYAR